MGSFLLIIFMMSLQTAAWIYPVVIINLWECWDRTVNLSQLRKLRFSFLEDEVTYLIWYR